MLFLAIRVCRVRRNTLHNIFDIAYIVDASNTGGAQIMFTDGLHKALGRDETHKTFYDANGLETILSEQTGRIDTYTILIHFFRETKREGTRHSRCSEEFYLSDHMIVIG